MTTKRLIISGFPCPKESWSALFCDGVEQRVLPLAEVIENTRCGDPRKWAKFVASQIESFAPSSIVCHDVGVTLTLLALLSLQRKGKLSGRPHLSIFNGAFRGFNVLEATHPFLVQLKGASAIKEQVESVGGHFDEKITGFMPLVKRFYLYVIANSLRELFVEKVLKQGTPAVGLDLPMQLIASSDDPYIPASAIAMLEKDFSITRVHQLNYGHFPYSLKDSKVLSLVQDFEQSGP